MSKQLSAKQVSISKVHRTLNRLPKSESYHAFDEIDGRHPWQSAVPDGFVPYPVRKLERGKVIYFNFALAREMGLISGSHPDELTPRLKEKVLETFSIQIINEYDQEHGSRVPKDTLKPHPYMATRYLQLQHANKTGATSGDGRSIWNGTIRHKGLTWDVSSRGTGVTRLAPGAVEADRPLKTGESQFGYGCGLADVSELVGSALMSEIFHLNGIQTERVLTIIDLGKGCGIGVRAAPNLIRPAHLFLYLKQGKLEPLRQATDYLIQRQIENGHWNFSSRSPRRYDLMLDEISKSFAQFAARLERNYIFAWMDWDGDNVLATAGIIDYGSIRQFGLRHDQYRYDDIQRFSTNLNEQRGKARMTVQVFAQLVDFLNTGRKKRMGQFSRHASIRAFDKEFDRELRRIFLTQVGLSEKQADQMIEQNSSQVEKLFSAFSALERTKTKSGLKTLPDGTNRPAVFNMRAALRELPAMILHEKGRIEGKALFPANEILSVISTSFAKRADRRLKGSLHRKIMTFQREYLNFIQAACDEKNRDEFVKELSRRAQEANRSGRITGNAAEFIVESILKTLKKAHSPEVIQSALDMFILSQAPAERGLHRRSKLSSLDSPVGRLYQEMLNIALEFQEDI